MHTALDLSVGERVHYTFGGGLKAETSPTTVKFTTHFAILRGCKFTIKH